MRVLPAMLVVLLGVGAVEAQTGSHGDGHAQHHDWYRDLRQPGSGISCCNRQDCRPVRAYVDEDGRWHALVQGRLVGIPWYVILKQSAPDGGSHLCMSQTGVVYCFVPGQPMS